MLAILLPRPSSEWQQSRYARLFEVWIYLLHFSLVSLRKPKCYIYFHNFRKDKLGIKLLVRPCLPDAHFFLLKDMEGCDCVVRNLCIFIRNLLDHKRRPGCLNWATNFVVYWPYAILPYARPALGKKSMIKNRIGIRRIMAGPILGLTETCTPIISIHPPTSSRSSFFTPLSQHSCR